MPRLQAIPTKVTKKSIASKGISLHNWESGSDLDNILLMMEKLLHWAAIIDSSDDAIISKSIEGYITSWNRGAQQLYGYLPSEVIGQPVSMLMPPEREDDFPKIMKELHEGHKVEHYETKRKTKDGRVIDVSLTVSPIRDSSGTIIGASKIARDITDRVEAEKRRDEFVSTASHELKTPITSQMVYGELLERMIEEQGDRQYLPLIHKMNVQTQKLEKLITDLLELSRLQVGTLLLEKKVVSVDDLVQEVIDDMQLTTQHSIILNQQVAHMKIIGDYDRLGQVLTNILSNAIKFSPQANQIIVTLSQRGTDVLISVQDFGIGIAPEHHLKVFERFFRVVGENEQTYPGMGIGLDFSNEVIQRHHGSIWVESAKGMGSTFYILLPQHRPQVKMKSS